MQNAQKALAHRDAHRVVAVARHRAALKQAMGGGLQLCALPRHAPTRLVIVIAKDGRPRNAEGVHQATKPKEGAPRIVKRAVDEVAREDNQIGAGLRDQRADVIATLRIKIRGVPRLDLVGAEPLGGAPPRGIDDLHIGQLEDADAPRLALLGKAEHKITSRKGSATRISQKLHSLCSFRIISAAQALAGTIKRIAQFGQKVNKAVKRLEWSQTRRPFHQQGEPSGAQKAKEKRHTL